MVQYCILCDPTVGWSFVLGYNAPWVHQRSCIHTEKPNIWLNIHWQFVERCKNASTWSSFSGKSWRLLREEGCRLPQWWNYRVEESLPSSAQLSAFPPMQESCKVEVTNRRRYVGTPPFRCSPWHKNAKRWATRHSTVRINGMHRKVASLWGVTRLV